MAQVIAIAWPEETSELAQAPGSWRWDLGQLPKMRNVVIAKALVWTNKGDADDLAKAEAFARRPDSAGGHDGSRVFVYPTSERDPIGRAKADLLESLKPAPAPAAPPKRKRAHVHGVKCLDFSGNVICGK